MKSVDVRRTTCGWRSENHFCDVEADGPAFRAVPWPEGAPPMASVPHAGTRVRVRGATLYATVVDGIPVMDGVSWSLVVRFDGLTYVHRYPLDHLTVLPDPPERTCLKGCGARQSWPSVTPCHPRGSTTFRYDHRFTDERKTERRPEAIDRWVASDIVGRPSRRMGRRANNRRAVVIHPPEEGRKP